MTAGLGKDPAEGRKKSPFQLALLKEIAMKIDELKAVEKRLGTPAEEVEDIERARELAHRVNNLLTTVLLGSDPGEDRAEA